MTQGRRLWWQDGVIYQIYPRSFQDSNGDGIGDLAGILSRLDYLVTLGVDAVWISPFYPSPMADFGYDVADYTGVDPMFGTMEDFDRLSAAIHERGLKLILDFVPNHSSDQHPWFLESRSSRDNPKRDWYLWRDPAPGGGVPNNWMSHFGGSAWQFDRRTGQYYLHSFLAAQPDLNWRNPAVHEAIYAAMRFWLDRGVDGFRMDVLWLLIKDDQFRSNPENPDWVQGSNSYGSLLPLYNSDRPETHEIVRQMRSVLDQYPERVLIGEIYLPLTKLVTYYGADPNTTELNGANMPFNFHLIQTPWKADDIARLIRNYEGLLPLGAWPNWVLGNHDQPRLATRVGEEQARVAAMLLLTLRGTPTLYYADELALPNGIIPPDEVQDPAEKNQPGIGMGRDPERTPMPWEASALAGFTTGRPWLPFSPNAQQLSVASQDAAPRSLLSLYRQLLSLRREREALHAGEVAEVHAEDNILSYQRTGGGQRLLVLLNLSDEIRQTEVPQGHVVMTTILDGAGAEVEGAFVLEAGEGVVIELAKTSVS
jgi:alpha-glucosidase